MMLINDSVGSIAHCTFASPLTIEGETIQAHSLITRFALAYRIFRGKSITVQRPLTIIGCYFKG